MKKILLLICLLSLASICKAEERKVVKNYCVTVTTSGVTAINQNLARAVIKFTNPTPITLAAEKDYAIWIATCPVSSSTYKTIGAYPIGPNYGTFDDNYFVYSSTWYAVCVDTYPCTLAIQERE